MNTTEKGNRLEDKLYEILADLIERDEFEDYKKERLSLYKKPVYYSDTREDNIEFDVAIEVSDPKKKETHKPRHTLIFECKNYNKPVNVNAVERFVKQTEDIVKSVGNVKPIFVTNVGVTKNAENYLKNNGCDYILLPDNQETMELDWIFQRSTSLYNSITEYEKEARQTLYTGILPKQYQLCCFNNNYIGYDIYLFIQDILTNIQPTKNKKITSPKIPYYSPDDIELLAQNIRQDNTNLGMTFLQDLIQLEQEKTGLSVEFCSNHNLGRLSSICFKKNHIKIYLQQNLHRNIFTLAHELAHYYLNHGQFLKKEYVTAQHFNTHIRNPELAKLEYQANMLAGCLLMPKDRLVADVVELLRKFNITNKGFGMIYLDEQDCNIQNFMKISQSLSAKYSVSMEALKIRLQGLNILHIADNTPKQAKFSLTDFMPNVLNDEVYY